MRTYSRCKLPKGFAYKDFKLTKNSRLKFRVCLFKTLADMRAEYKECSLETLEPGVMASVSCLTADIYNTKTDKWREDFDKDYFCCIGFVQKHISTETVTHEAVHAGFCYAYRVQKDIFPSDGDTEERIAYPAGKIAKHIFNWLHDEDLYPKRKK